MDLKPDYLVTATDEFYRKKKKDAVEAGIQVITDKKNTIRVTNRPLKKS